MDGATGFEPGKYTPFSVENQHPADSWGRIGDETSRFFTRSHVELRIREELPMNTWDPSQHPVMARSRQKYAVAALVILTLSASVWFALGFIRPSVGYQICAEFASMPADDEALEQWLRTQPDVVGHTVHAKRDGRKLDLFYIISRDFRRPQGLPAVEAQCRLLGYNGQVSPFRDCSR